MKIQRFCKFVGIRLAVLMLMLGIGWGTTRTDSFFVYSQADMMYSISDSTDRFAESTPAVLSSTNIREVELIQNKGSVYRSYLGSGTGEQLISYSIFHYLFPSKQQSRDAIAECDAVGSPYSSKIIKYVHQTDGEKG